MKSFEIFCSVNENNKKSRFFPSLFYCDLIDTSGIEMNQKLMINKNVYVFTA